MSDGRVEQIPEDRRFGSPAGEVVHYGARDLPARSPDQRVVRALCRRVLYSPTYADDRRICEDCWSVMVYDPMVETVNDDY